MSSANATLTIFDLSPYHYVPTRSVTIIFIVLFGLSTAMHLFQAVKYRMWWLLPTVCLCGFLELLGWSARLWSSINPFIGIPFEIQITGTIIAPTPFIAANFIILGKIVQQLGPAYSRLSPKRYTIIFCTCDFVSLVIQAIGGGIAATAQDLNTANLGAKIMLSGIVFQLVVILTYSFCAIEYYLRYSKKSPFTSYSDKEANPGTIVRGICTEKLRHMAYAMVFMTTCLIIRAIYRTIELSGGWNGRVISIQVYFNVLDGAMIVLVVYTMNLAHPGRLLAASSEDNNISTN